MSDLLDKAKASLEKFVGEMTSSGDYSTVTKQRANDVERGVSTYKQQGKGGAAANAVDAIKARKKMLDEI